MISRPPAKRRIVRGSASRNAATALSASRGQHVEVAERRARARVEEVQRHLVGIQLGELRGELGALLERLAHAEDAAAADLHAGFADHPQRVPALLPGVRGDDVAGRTSARSPGCGCSGARPSPTAVDLLLGEHAERAGDLDVDLVADRLDARGDLRHQPLVRSADGGDDAELGRAGLGGLLGGLDQARDVEPGAAHRARRTGRTASRSGSPRGSRRSSG